MVLPSGYHQLPLFPTEPTEKVCTGCGRFFPLSDFYRKRGTADGLTTACKDCIKARVHAYQEQNQEKIRASRAARYEANPEQVKAQSRARYQRNREACLEQKRIAYEPERERRKALRQAREEAAGLAQEKQCSRCERLLPLDAFYAKKSGRYGLTGRCKECIKERARGWHWDNRERSIAKSRAYFAAHADALRAAVRAYEHAHRAERYAARKAAPGRYTIDDVQAIYLDQDGLCAYCAVALEEVYHIDHMIPLSRGGSNWPDNLALACPTCNLRKGAKTAAHFRALLQQQL